VDQSHLVGIAEDLKLTLINDESNLTFFASNDQKIITVKLKKIRKGAMVSIMF
jgi:hypothetical protein